MDQEKLKVILLGYDSQLLKNVTERVNSQRPVEVLYITELKEFLAICMEERPDLVGVSVSYPHQKAPKFPEIFKMALNTPVLTFGENQNFKTRKALSTSTADLKIQGVITAHNLWMKIVNFQKLREEEIDKVKKGQADKDGAFGDDSIFLKNDKPKDSAKKNSILNSLFSALDGTNLPSETNQNEKYKKDGSEEESFDSIEKSKVEKKSQSPEGSEGQEIANHSHLSGEKKHKKTNQRGANDVNTKASKLSGLLDDVSEKTPTGEVSDREEKENKFNINKKSTQGILNPEPNKNKTEPNDPEHSKSKNSSIKEEKKRKSANGILALQDENAKSKSKKPQKEYGKIQLTDEKEIKEEEKRKNKEKTKREQARQKNVLETASEVALEKVFKAPRAKEIKRFNTNKIIVFTVDLGKIKGYLLLTTVDDKNISKNLAEFKVILIEVLKENGASGNISNHYIIDTHVKNYIASVAEFSDFNINHQNQEETYFNVAFVQREVILPTLNESDKSDMFFVDIKVIPPQTPVKFDAFIYLPRNKRFVRYLKEGRSLSLKQAKRHSEDEGQSQLYLPKTQKRRFEEFYIQNTLSWEFALHKKNDAA